MNKTYQYHSLADANRHLKKNHYGETVEANEFWQCVTFGQGDTQVWYTRDMDDKGKSSNHARDLRMGVEFCREQGIPLPTLADLHKTHVYLGNVAHGDKEAVYAAMQGENWSPNGEARAFIARLGLRHTSMSMGDALVVDGKCYLVDTFGFALMADAPADAGAVLTTGDCQ